MTTNDKYDVAIIGGGLAGLAAAILLARQGHLVVLFEKEAYPFHKVCGEYVSMESLSFLSRLGVPLDELQLPIINLLQLTSPAGNAFSTRLPLGGFGISRFRLDECLFELAKKYGVLVLEKTRVLDADFDGRFRLRSNLGDIHADVCCGAFGKRSNMDVKWGRSFLKKNAQHNVNYVAVKYHVKTDWPENTIGLHNFSDGYCGISKIEGDRYCLCYLTTANNLRACNNNIADMEKNLLQKNPHLKKIFSGSEFLDGFPEVISQISFRRKTLVENHVLMLGDAAGMITPLCGNGMSIALRTSQIAASLVDSFLKRNITREEMEEMYARQWQADFSKRLSTGRMLQRFFGSDRLSNLFVTTFKAFPFLASPLIKMTHGKPF